MFESPTLEDLERLQEEINQIDGTLSKAEFATLEQLEAEYELQYQYYGATSRYRH